MSDEVKVEPYTPEEFAEQINKDPRMKVAWENTAADFQKLAREYNRTRMLLLGAVVASGGTVKIGATVVEQIKPTHSVAVGNVDNNFILTLKDADDMKQVEGKVVEGTDGNKDNEPVTQ